MRVWDLPGGKRFIGAVCNLLRAGGNVVVRFPSETPAAFDHVIEAKIGDLMRIRHIVADSEPLKSLATQFAPKPENVRRIKDLLEEPSFRSLLVRVSVPDKTKWKQWHEFLIDYADMNRSRPLPYRSLFLATIEWSSVVSESYAVGFDGLDWRGHLDGFELLLYVNEYLREGEHTSVIRDLLSYSIVNLAGSDSQFAEKLVDEKASTVLDPHRLRQSCSSYFDGVKRYRVDWQLSIRNGVRLDPNLADAEQLDMKADLEGIKDCLARAQITVLLPWIELQRQAILDKHLNEVRRHMRAYDDDDIDPLELEIGQLRRYFDRGGANKRIRIALRLLVHARNKLAHRGVMSYEEILKLVSDASITSKPVRNQF